MSYRLVIPRKKVEDLFTTQEIQIFCKAVKGDCRKCFFYGFEEALSDILADRYGFKRIVFQNCPHINNSKHGSILESVKLSILSGTEIRKLELEAKSLSVPKFIYGECRYRRTYSDVYMLSLFKEYTAYLKRTKGNHLYDNN